MLEILIKFAPRLATLINLRPQDHFIRPDPKKSLITAIIIPEHETKNSRSLTYPVKEGTAELLDLWITQFRPLIAPLRNPYLFPGKGDGPMTLQGVRDSIKRITEERIGVAMNPHLFRHFAAKMFLNAIPGSYEGVRQLLGHALASSATRMYCDTEDQAATEMFDKILETERAALGVKKRQKRRRPKTKISKKQIRKAS
jgi:integrase